MHHKYIDQHLKKPYTIKASYMYASYLVEPAPDDKTDDAHCKKPLEKKRGSVSLTDLRRANKGEMPDVDFEIVSSILFQN